LVVVAEGCWKMRRGIAKSHLEVVLELRDTLPQLLDGGGVTNEDGGHLQALRWDVANRGLDVVRDPLNKV